MKFGIDFDGTCVDHCYPHVGTDVPCAVETMRKLVDLGALLILYTNRDKHYLDDAVAWFKRHKIPLYGINRDPEQDMWTTSPKLFAHYYIDDRNIGIPMIRPDGFNRDCVDWEWVADRLFNTAPRVCKTNINRAIMVDNKFLKEEKQRQEKRDGV